jgi:C1q domain
MDAGGPAFSAYASAGVSMVNSALTKILFQTEDFDTNNNYDNSTSKFTPTVAGYYQITATISAPAQAGAYFQGSIYKNGVQFAVGVVSAANGIYVTQVSSLVYCNGSTDYIEIYGVQVTGGTITSNANALYKFQGALVRPA